MRYQNLLFAILLAALAIVSFLWYRTVQQLEAYQQYQQDLAPMFSLCQRFVATQNEAVFQNMILVFESYIDGTNKKYRDRYKSMDALCDASIAQCDTAHISVLPNLLRTYADSVHLYTDRDTDIVQAVHTLLKNISHTYTPDSLLRRGAVLKLKLLQGIGYLELAKRSTGMDFLDYSSPLLVPKQLEATVGKPFEATLHLTHHHKPKLFQEWAYINNQPCRLINWKSDFKTIFPTSGVHTLTLKTESINTLTGENRVIIKTVEVNVKP